MKLKWFREVSLETCAQDLLPKPVLLTEAKSSVRFTVAEKVEVVYARHPVAVEAGSHGLSTTDRGAILSVISGA
jgi:hypothetical protein